MTRSNCIDQSANKTRKDRGTRAADTAPFKLSADQARRLGDLGRFGYGGVFFSSKEPGRKICSLPLAWSKRSIVASKAFNPGRKRQKREERKRKKHCKRKKLGPEDTEDASNAGQKNFC